MTDAPRSVAVFCMGGDGHFQRLHPIIVGLVGRGIAVNVFTQRTFAAAIGRAGGIFHDLFGAYPLEAADDRSVPVPCRWVTYAATFADQISRDVAATGPSLVIHDLFAVIGRVVAHRLGLPRVTVCAGHNVVPQRYLEMLPRDPRVRIAPECLRAVEVLRESCGIADASPFCYVAGLSPSLNLYCEPPEFLHEDERPPFAPLAFFGSIPAADGGGRIDRAGLPRSSLRTDRKRRIFVSFGTVIWWYYAADAVRALTALTTACARRDDLRMIVSLGGASIAPEQVAALTHANVAVEPYVDQWRLLQEADAVVTHHGLNSTHEAIFHRVPMISYPFFWDQPALARRAQAFGLAVPLVALPRGAVCVADVDAALDRLAAEAVPMHAALARARQWELAVMADRPAVLQQVVDLMA